MKELLIRARGGTPALALLENRRLLEYAPLQEDSAVASGAVYLGRAGRVMKGLGAMFVRLAPGVEGFLPFNELAGMDRPAPGDSLIVQIKRPAQGGKSAYLTCDIALPGRGAMLLPRGNYAHVSRRARDPAALRALARRLCPPGMGLVLRARAEQLPLEELAAEIASQQAYWEELRSRARAGAAPMLLAPAPGALQRLQRDERVPPERIVTDDEQAAAGLGLPVQLHSDPFSLYGVERQLRRALGRRVFLPSGGFLVLDQCEAALLIDVNSGGDSRRADDLTLRVNLEAAGEIARLLRLRRAGGIILIDFIDMPGQDQRDAVQAALAEALREDRVSSEVLGFTRLGLMEMTRRKAEAALEVPLEREEEEQDIGDA
ncbi:MAG TPA: ribonuclease E/G [Clostridia bacterium]|nr:ribonuclease E/G [Clostridia bacterium]